MKLASILTPKARIAALAVADGYIDLNATDPGLPSCIKHLLAASPAIRKAAAEVASSKNAVKYAANAVKLLPPVPKPGKILCIGLNYRDHAIEGNKPIPDEPVIFGKFQNARRARRPDQALEGEQEGRLRSGVGPAIDRQNRQAHPERLLPPFDYVGGYTCGHDVSDRTWQFIGAEKQWIIGKTFDTFAPTGPVLVTADELTNPHKLQVQLRLNGTTLQNSNTKEFIFGVPHLLWYLSQCVTLEPGDLIFTGTPPGVGIARNPQILLKPGDVAEVEIEGIGTLRNPVVAE